MRTYSKKFGDCPILVTEREAVRQTILVVIKMESSKVCINTDSKIVVNALKRKMTVPKDILILVKDIKWLSVYFKVFVLKYCYRNDNREADIIAKKTHA